jgi:predicted nucleotidyltransferase
MIYVHPQDWYLSIEDRKETLEFPLNGELDISGWDLKKGLQIFRKSNAVIFEWLQSPIVYQNKSNFAKTLYQLVPQYFSPRTVIHHHLGLVHKAYGEINQEKDVKLKKYFYVLRSLLSAMWVKNYELVPPMEFKALFPVLENHKSITDLIENLLILKAKADESTRIEVIPALHQFIEKEFMDCQLFAKSARIVHGDTLLLNQLFRQTVAGLSL